MGLFPSLVRRLHPATQACLPRISKLEDNIDKINDAVNRIVRIAKTQTASVLVNYRHDQAQSIGYKSLSRTISLTDDDEIKTSSVEDDKLLFCTASLTKVFIAAAACLWVDDDDWNRAFTAVFNLHSKDVQILDLPGNPTVLSLLIHHNGIRSMNHLILAPDGAPILSRQELLATILRYSTETHGKYNSGTDWCEYSNADYILVAMLIESISGMSLWEALNSKLFNPLGMHRTCLNSDMLSQYPQAHPHVVSSTGKRRLISYGPHLNDLVEMVVFGAWTCTYDVGLFFKSLIMAIDQKPNHPLFGERFLNRFFNSIVKIDGFNEHGYMPAGLLSTFDTIVPGSHSLNRLLHNGDVAKNVLGNMADGYQLQGFSYAGSATGWGCTAFFIPKKRVFVVVLTNTSGLLDASDHIARVYLQALFDLQPARVKEMDTSKIGIPLPNMDTDGRRRDHLVQVAGEMAYQNSKPIAVLEDEAKIPDAPSNTHRGVCGIYRHKYCNQYLFVVDCLGVLRVFMTGLWTSRQRPEFRTRNGFPVITAGDGIKVSQLMRFVCLTSNGKEEVFRICTLQDDVIQKEKLPGSAIDCYGDWLNRDFMVTRDDNGVVTHFSRTGTHVTDTFFREDP